MITKSDIGQEEASHSNCADIKLSNIESKKQLEKPCIDLVTNGTSHANEHLCNGFVRKQLEGNTDGYVVCKDNDLSHTNHDSSKASKEDKDLNYSNAYLYDSDGKKSNISLNGDSNGEVFSSIEPTKASNIIEHEFDSDNNDVFYFESDHVALKGNSEYHSLLKTVALLEAQRKKALTDLDALLACEEKALSNPVCFVEQLRQSSVDLPKRQSVVVLPKIHWNNYTKNVDPINFGKHRHMTRMKVAQPTTENGNQAIENYVVAGECGSDVQKSDGQDGLEVVRGRVKDSSKTETFNKLWTVEEQQLLERLLHVYPEEPIEARRWNKIANALGNRTPQQVQSRVQKYFIKLTKAGLPVPGRKPATFPLKKQSIHKHRRLNHLMLHRPSTFMQSYIPPVYMNDEFSGDSENQDSFYASFSATNVEGQDLLDFETNQSIDIKAFPEYEELVHLMKMRKAKLKEDGQVRHIGFKCDRCECDPIIGMRWNCVDCPSDTSVDFCNNCFGSNFETETHNSSHRLEKANVQSAPSAVDSDYTHFLHGDYSYLDPNYMPAS